MNNFILLLGLIKSMTPYIKKHLISQLAYHEFLLINNPILMFNGKSKSDASDAASGTSLIGTGTVITGNVVSNGDVRIDGKLIGNISGGTAGTASVFSHR